MLHLYIPILSSIHVWVYRQTFYHKNGKIHPTYTHVYRLKVVKSSENDVPLRSVTLSIFTGSLSISHVFQFSRDVALLYPYATYTRYFDESFDFGRMPGLLAKYISLKLLLQVIWKNITCHRAICFLLLFLGYLLLSMSGFCVQITWWIFLLETFYFYFLNLDEIVINSIIH